MIRLFAVACTLVIAIGNAAADRVFVGQFAFSGKPLVEATRTNLQKNFLDGLAASGLEVVSPADVERARKSDPKLVGCNSIECLAILGEILSARHAVLVTITTGNTSNNYTFALQLFDTKPARMVSEIEDQCEVCPVAEANRRLASCAASLRTAMAPPPTAATTSVSVGSLARAAKPARRRYRIAAAVTMALGIPLLAAGAALWAIDGTVHHTNVPAGTSATPITVDRYETRAIGIPLTVAGAALTVTSAVMWGLDVRDGKRRNLTVAPMLGPLGGLYVGGTF